MGNKASNDGGRIPRSISDRGSSSMLTSAEEIEAWLPDSMEKVKAGTLPATRDVDWDDENNVMRETQVGHEHLQTACIQSPCLRVPAFGGIACQCRSSCLLRILHKQQLNTIHNLVEEQKTLKRSSSFAGKLANLSIGKARSRSKKDGKKGLVRSVSFSHIEREEVTFEENGPQHVDLDASSSEDTSEDL